MANPIGGGWHVTQGGQKVRGKAAAEALEAQETAAPVAVRSGRPTPRQLAIDDSAECPGAPGLIHSLVRGQGDGGPVVRCIREGCDYERRRW